MKNQSSKRKFFGIFICMLFAFTAMAFQDSAKVNKHIEKSILDTVPKNHDIDIQIDTKGLEETIKKSVELAEKTIKQIDWDKISKQAELTIKQIDLDRILKEVEQSLKKIDMDKISKEVEQAIKKIDLDKINIEIKKAKSDTQKKELKKEIEKLKEELEMKKKELKNANQQKA